MKFNKLLKYSLFTILLAGSISMMSSCSIDKEPNKTNPITCREENFNYEQIAKSIVTINSNENYLSEGFFYKSDSTYVYVVALADSVFDLNTGQIYEELNGYINTSKTEIFNITLHKADFNKNVAILKVDVSDILDKYTLVCLASDKVKIADKVIAIKNGDFAIKFVNELKTDGFIFDGYSDDAIFNNGTLYFNAYNELVGIDSANSHQYILDINYVHTISDYLITNSQVYPYEDLNFDHNKVKKISYRELENKIIAKEDFILFLGSPICELCQSHINTLESFKTNYSQINIYYFDIFDYNSSSYIEINQLLDAVKNITSEDILNMPITIKVVDGEFIDVKTSVMTYTQIKELMIKYYELSVGELATKMNNGKDLVFVFSSNTCAHCAAFKPKMEQYLAKYHKEAYYIEYTKLDLDEYSTLISIIKTYNLTYSPVTPTTVAIKNGRVVNVLTGDIDYNVLENFMNNN